MSNGLVKNEVDMEDQVEVVAKPWSDSPYYEDAERWTHLFWEDSTIFRSMFERMDLTATLELACGHGRHAEQCVDRTGSLVVMDIFQDNLDISLARLPVDGSVSSHKNDGHTFNPIADASLTAIFCYDAMVHFSPDIVESYIKDAVRVLKPGGKALFHHSNYPAPLDQHYGQNPHARNHMTKELFQTLCDKHGMNVVESQVMGWGGVEGLDCVTLMQKDYSVTGRLR